MSFSFVDAKNQRLTLALGNA